MSSVTLNVFALLIAMGCLLWQALSLGLPATWIAFGLSGLVGSGLAVGAIQAKWHKFAEKLGMMEKSKEHLSRASLPSIRAHGAW